MLEYTCKLFRRYKYYLPNKILRTFIFKNKWFSFNACKVILGQSTEWYFSNLERPKNFI